MGISVFTPKVSIIIPVFNGGKYLREAIDSALSQSYNNCEIIVVNDGSSDSTELIALSYGNLIKYFYKENGGQSTALNLGIKKMTGEYFSWLSHDDIYYPEKVETQMRFLTSSNAENLILYSNFEVINHASRCIRKTLIPFFDSRLFRYMLLISSPINGCTALIPKKAFYEIGMFNENRPHTSDVELFFKMAKKYSFVHLPEILVKSRTHSEQMSHLRSKYHNYESNLFLIYGLENITKNELLETGLKYPNILLVIAENWASRGYRKAYSIALKSYLNSEGRPILYVYTKITCVLRGIRKTFRETLKSIIKSIHKMH